MTTRTQSPTNHPRVGMLATVRNRRGIISAVEPFGTGDGLLHLARIEYIDADGTPEDSLLWERERNATLLEPTALPRVADLPPMRTDEFDALQRAARWSALSPYLIREGESQRVATPVSAPLFGAIQAEDFQLVPLLKALRMPRISMLLGDDVGLGKTIEAGLILTELLLRRRIRRVLIICPAALRTQWQQEMQDKFSLGFEVIDRAETYALQKRLGLDANPWRTYPRIITSYYYLRQPDILEQFRAACSQPVASAQLPWDLLIVDEAHNLMPSNFGEDSDLAQMLRTISPWFEHKLFLTATPHNGHTRCFSGLLEMLDPVRFTQSSEFSDAQRRRAEEVIVRRLKREINELDEQAGRPLRFSARIPEPLPLYFDRKERLLSLRFQEFRRRVKELIRAANRTEQLAGSFAVEVLNKRLLSSPYTFADSWYRLKAGITQSEEAKATEVRAAHRAVGEDLDDDLEAEGRIRHAARTIGAWLKPLAAQLVAEIANVDEALQRLGFAEQNALHSWPDEDARWDRLLQLIQDRLHDGQTWLDDERLIIFTEYKTTLDYLAARLQQRYTDHPARIRVLYGGMDDPEREGIKQAFNDPADPMRILVATDAASEGLNLQETARYVLHYDVPFNPARLDQRNGRLDRHGQARDVIVFHYTSTDDADLNFLGYVVDKVNTIREELGSMGEVFDAAFERQFSFLDDPKAIIADLDAAIDQRRGRVQIPTTAPADMAAERAALAWLAHEIDLNPASLRATLEQALAVGIGLPRFDVVDDAARVRLRMPLPEQWSAFIDDHLRRPVDNGQQSGALPALTFDPTYFIQQRNGRPVFRPAKDTVLLHLGHPMFRKALTTFARARFPGGEGGASRWIVRYGAIPAQADALLLLTVEELAVNDLREPFHYWVRTVRCPVVNGELRSPLPHLPSTADQPLARAPGPELTRTARDLWDAIEFDVRDLVKTLATQLTRDLQAQLRSVGKFAQAEETARFKERIREVEQAMRQTTLTKLEREWESYEEARTALQLQPLLFAEEQQSRERELERKQTEVAEELRRRQDHYHDLLEQLKAEEERVIRQILPRRYRLRGEAQVFPVTVELRLPLPAQGMEVLA